MDKNITDIKGIIHKVDTGKTYTIIYTNKNDLKIKVLNRLYQNYPHQGWIGHDSEDGTCDPINDRVYFDGVDVPKGERPKVILWVGTDDEWQKFLKKSIFN